MYKLYKKAIITMTLTLLISVAGAQSISAMKNDDNKLGKRIIACGLFTVNRKQKIKIYSIKGKKLKLIQTFETNLEQNFLRRDPIFVLSSDGTRFAFLSDKGIQLYKKNIITKKFKLVNTLENTEESIFKYDDPLFLQFNDKNQLYIYTFLKDNYNKSNYGQCSRMKKFTLPEKGICTEETPSEGIKIDGPIAEPDYFTISQGFTISQDETTIISNYQIQYLGGRQYPGGVIVYKQNMHTDTFEKHQIFSTWTSNYEPGSNYKINSLSLNTKGNKALITTNRRTECPRIWDISSIDDKEYVIHRPKIKIKHGDCTFSHFSQDSKTIVLLDDHTIMLLDAKTQEEIGTFDMGQEDYIISIAISNNISKTKNQKYFEKNLSHIKENKLRLSDLIVKCEQ